MWWKRAAKSRKLRGAVNVRMSSKLTLGRPTFAPRKRAGGAARQVLLSFLFEQKKKLKN
jgi:hypothetical protein